MDKNNSHNYSKPMEVAKGIYWVNSHDPKELFHCNPYLLIDGQEAVLFDPVRTSGKNKKNTGRIGWKKNL